MGPIGYAQTKELAGPLTENVGLSYIVCDNVIFTSRLRRLLVINASGSSKVAYDYSPSIGLKFLEALARMVLLRLTGWMRNI